MDENNFDDLGFDSDDVVVGKEDGEEDTDTESFGDGFEDFGDGFGDDDSFGDDFGDAVEVSESELVDDNEDNSDDLTEASSESDIDFSAFDFGDDLDTEAEASDETAENSESASIAELFSNNAKNSDTSADFSIEDDEETEASETEKHAESGSYNRFEFEREDTEGEDIDFDAIWEENEKEDEAPSVDMRGMNNLPDDGDLICIALAHGDQLVYLTHGTEGKLGHVLKFLGAALGGRLVRFKLEGEDIEKLKDDSVAFSETFRKYMEV